MRLVTLTNRPVGVRLLSRRPAAAHDWVQASWPIDSVDAAVLDVLALGRDVEVLRPAELRDAVAAEARAVAERHEGSGDGAP